jgi:hypothetical protein
MRESYGKDEEGVSETATIGMGRLASALSNRAWIGPRSVAFRES